MSKTMRMKGGISSKQIMRALKNNRDDDNRDVITTKEKPQIYQENQKISELYKNSLFLPDKDVVTNQVAKVAKVNIKVVKVNLNKAFYFPSF